MPGLFGSGDLLPSAGRRPFASSINRLSKRRLSSSATLIQVRFPARSGRQLNRQVVAEEVVKVAQQLDGEEVQRKPDRPTPVGVAAEEAGARLAGLIVEATGPTVEIDNQRVFKVIPGERSQPVRRQEFALVEHTGQDALEARLLNQRDQARPVSRRQIVKMVRAVAYARGTIGSARETWAIVAIARGRARLRRTLAEVPPWSAPAP